MNHKTIELINNINHVLPQTQCTQCGHNGCAPYAHAIVVNHEAINQCPPGGQLGIVKLANLTGRPVTPLNPNNGVELPLAVACIIESECIGCTKCIQACPVDAIVGAAKLMHSVLSDLCTGCGLCIPPCPVDCIDMPIADKKEWLSSDAHNARIRFESRNQRLARLENDLNQKRIEKNQTNLIKMQEHHDEDTEKKRSIVQAALSRARERRNS